MMDLSKGKILITGGSGFIGSGIAWELNKRGHENILIADHLRSSEKWKNLVNMRFVDYIEGDNLDDLLTNRPEQLLDIKTIFHLGACSSTTETNVAYLIRNNYEFTKSLAHFALAHDIRFVYASSAATYGSLEKELRETLPLASLKPLNAYAYSKHLFDCHAEQAGFLSRITGLKYFNIFGPNEQHKGDMRSIVAKAFDQIQETGKVSLFKSYRTEFPDGEQSRDFLYVKDAVETSVTLAESVAGGGLFNVGSGKPTTWTELATAVFTALGKKPHIEFVDMPPDMRSKYQYSTCADLTKLRSVVAVKPPMPVTEAINDYVRNYLVSGLRLGSETSGASPMSTPQHA
jgi:ADP-L-glycero-D-manno-heptose 6-epimerase